MFGVGIAALVENQDIRNNAQLEDVLLLALFFGVLVSMFVGLALDIILKPRRAKHHRFRWLIHPIATIQRKVAPLGRFREILRYARRPRPPALRVVVEARDAGVRAPVAPDPRGLRRHVREVRPDRIDALRPAPRRGHHRTVAAPVVGAPVAADEIREVVERELGATVEEEFASFDFEPLAAASIGQTHRAVLKTGERVVVKVQRPGIEDVVHRDAAVLRMAASAAERRVEAARQLGVKRLAEELITSLERELDYSVEAASGVAFLAHIEDKEGIAAPIVYQALSTRRVLVMQEIAGVTVADHEAVDAADVDANVLAIRLLRSFLDQVLRDGLYHADPHPGNIFVAADGTLWFLDFGAVGRLSPIVLESLQEMAIGFQLNDPVVLARATNAPRRR